MYLFILASNSCENIHQRTLPSSLFNQLKTPNGTIMCKTINNGIKNLGSYYFNLKLYIILQR